MPRPQNMTATELEQRVYESAAQQRTKLNEATTPELPREPFPEAPTPLAVPARSTEPQFWGRLEFELA